jgi:oligoribonuclease
MTGLDPETDTIMSLACFITDYDLNLLDEDGFEAVIHHSKEQLDRMGEWCTDHHGDSGLTQACLDSTTTADEAAQGLLKYIQEYVPKSRTALLAGNSVHADKSFLVKAPYDTAIDYLHYRILDVSSIKEAARRWAPVDTLKKIPRKKMLHEARADILESIAEAKFYRETFFKS